MHINEDDKNKFDRDEEDIVEDDAFVDEPSDYDTYDLEMSHPEDYEYDDFDPMFANSGSALRAATPTNPRNQPCPTCKAKNVLTPQDVALHYQCDRCANNTENGGGY